MLTVNAYNNYGSIKRYFLYFQLKNNTQFITPDERLEHLKGAQQILVKVNDLSEEFQKKWIRCY